MNKNLDRIEAHLRALFEDKLLKIFTGNQPHHSLIEELMDATRQNLRSSNEDKIFAPDQFIIHVPGEDFLEWNAHQDILDQMAISIYEKGLNSGFFFEQKPRISLSIDDKIFKNEFVINAMITEPKPIMADTSPFTSEESEHHQNQPPRDAYFVVGGDSNFPLEKNLINIGRHSDCDLILDDLHVSRHHAQLRAINQQFVIFDVGSTGGLFLNGKRISQATLQSGDVIRIGITNLIYIQDATSPNATMAIPMDEQSQTTTNTPYSEDNFLGGNEE